MVLATPTNGRFKLLVSGCLSFVENIITHINQLLKNFLTMHEVAEV
jgi:hypothetical protein